MTGLRCVVPRVAVWTPDERTLVISRRHAFRNRLTAFGAHPSVLPIADEGLAGVLLLVSRRHPDHVGLCPTCQQFSSPPVHRFGEFGRGRTGTPCLAPVQSYHGSEFGQGAPRRWRRWEVAPKTAPRSKNPHLLGSNTQNTNGRQHHCSSLPNRKVTYFSQHGHQ